MSRIDELPADRRAVLALLLKQGKSYDELAGLLRIARETVRERARDALDRLGPAEGSGLTLERQDEIADYLLGQQSPSQQSATRGFLEDSAAARAWARVVSGELRDLAADALPEIPAERAEAPRAPAEAPARRTPRASERRGSRLGGVLLLGGIGVAIALIIVFAVSGSGDNGTTTTSKAGRTTPTTSTAAAQPRVLGQVNLKPPSGAASKALAAVTLVRQGNETDILFQGQGLPPNKAGDVYALWVTGPTGAARLGFMPRVAKAGTARFPGALPSQIDLSKYDTLLMTRETSQNPARPGPVILSGKLPNAA